MPERCVFCKNTITSSRCAITAVECDGLKDKQRCPFWAVVQALSRIETAVQMLEVRE